MGGPDEEHDISLRSGTAVVDGLKKAEWNAIPVVIKRDGLWHYPDGQARTVGRAIDQLRRDEMIVFIALHGRTGEGGIIQATLELANVAFTGSDARSSSLAMDKEVSRVIYEHAGIPVPPGAVVYPSDHRSPYDVAEELVNTLGLPVFTKHVDSGSSYGVRMDRTMNSLSERIRKARIDSVRLLVEQAIDGPEFTVAVLDGDAGTSALPPVLIRPRGDAEFFTLEVKYDAEAVDEICPAPVEAEKLRALADLGLSAHRVLGCRDFSRTDVMWSSNGPVVLETNTIPGLTKESLFPKAANAAGISFSELVSHLTESAHRRKGSGR